jgi:hypothetical protein
MRMRSRVEDKTCSVPTSSDRFMSVLGACRGLKSTILVDIDSFYS